MPASKKATTRLSTKGQVILPKAVRDACGWKPGATLTVEQTDEGVLLRPASPFPPTRIEDVFGSLKYDGPPISVEDMDLAVAEGFRRRYGRD